MKPYRDIYLAIIIEDHETTTYEFLARIADGKGLECRIVTEWDETGEIPRKILDNRIRLVFYGIKFDSQKTEFTVLGYVFGDFPVGLKPGKCELTFNRFLLCSELPEEMFESDDEVLVSASELLGSNNI